MDPITKLISYISPTLAAKRIRSQVAVQMMEHQIRKFDGAGHGRRFNNWGDSTSSQNQQIATSLNKLRERARDMARNNGYAKNAIRRIGNNVVGTGIMASPVSKNPNIASKKVEEDKVKEIWKEWAESTECDFDGMQNLYGIQKMIAKTAAKSGSCLVRRVWKKYKKGAISLQLQVLEPDFLDRSRTGITFDNGEYTFHGVQFDSNGKRKAYWIFDRHPLDFKIESKPVPAEDIRHVFDVEDPGQVDGLPFFSSVILSMLDFHEYTDAQLMKQKVAAAFAAYIHDDSELLNGTTTSNDKSTVTERIEPGTIQHLNSGQTITFANPPSTEGSGEYSRQSLLGQAAGIGLSYESYTGDLSNVNFSSGRMGWIEGHRNVEDWQWNMMITMFCNPVWKWFTQAAKLSGLIPDQNIGVTWTPPRREMIDPVKETKALSELVRNGFMSWQDAIRQLGYNPEEILAELKSDAKAFDDAKLMPSCDPRYDSARINDPIEPGAGPNPINPVKKVSPKKVKATKTA